MVWVSWKPLKTTFSKHLFNLTSISPNKRLSSLLGLLYVRVINVPGKFSLALVAIFCVSTPVLAGEKYFQFACGPAQFSVAATPYEDDGSLGMLKVVISAHTGTDSIQLLFDNAKRVHQAEYFAARCLKAKKRDYFVFQNHCGGSGCREDNYGIIDAKSLEVLLTPSMPNQSQVKLILGTNTPSLTLIDPDRSVKRDARHLP